VARGQPGGDKTQNVRSNPPCHRRQRRRILGTQPAWLADTLWEEREGSKKSRNEGRTHDLIDNKGSVSGTHDVYENKLLTLVGHDVNENKPFILRLSIDRKPGKCIDGSGAPSGRMDLGKRAGDDSKKITSKMKESPTILLKTKDRIF
jgi:hypothetical protein